MVHHHVDARREFGHGGQQEFGPALGGAQVGEILEKDFSEGVMASGPLPEGMPVGVGNLSSERTPRLTTAHQLTLLRTVHEV
ncbi:hypothetical protein ADK96_11345, partial [Streptomyces sp. IGB124]